MTSLDLDAISAEFLNQCGPCDFAVAGLCSCSDHDFRPAMLALGREVERLRTTLAAVAAVHQQHEGRCVECLDFCDCPDRHTCEHGNVEWPCATAKAGGFA